MRLSALTFSLVLLLASVCSSQHHRARRRRGGGGDGRIRGILLNPRPASSQPQGHYRYSSPRRRAGQLQRRRLHTIDDPHAVSLPPAHYVYEPVDRDFALEQQHRLEEEERQRLRLTLHLEQLPYRQHQQPSLRIRDSRVTSLHYVPDHLVTEEEEHQHRAQRRRKRRRRKLQQVDRQTAGGGCPGRCVNILSCMVHSGRPLRNALTETEESCPGMLQVCCVGPNHQAVQSLRQHHRPRRGHLTGSRRGSGRGRARNRGVHGRSLGHKQQYLQPPPPPLPHPLDSLLYSAVPGARPVSTEVVEARRPNVYASNFIEAEQEAEDACGRSRPKPKNVADRRIMGGLDAGYGQFPWTAHIKIRGPGIDKECGGTLVNRRWILTAGHCTQYCVTVPLCAVEIPQHEITYKVILGEYDHLTPEYFPADSYLAIDVIRHPLYRNAMRFRENGFLESEPRYDVAMLMLDRDARIAPNVAPICLPQEPFTELTPGALGTVVGWGRTGRGESSPHSTVLQAASVPILSDADCFLQTGLENFSDQICAGEAGGEESACPGDSGGALQIQDSDGRWMVVGVVSNGPSVCGLQPVVFHKVSNTLAWIHNVIERQNGKKSHHQQLISAVPK